MQLCTHPKNVDNSLVGVTCADLLRRCDNVKLCCRTATSGSADGLLSFLAAQGPCCRTITQVTSEACFAKWFRSTTQAAQSYRDTRKRVSQRLLAIGQQREEIDGCKECIWMDTRVVGEPSGTSTCANASVTSCQLIPPSVV